MPLASLAAAVLAAAAAAAAPGATVVLDAAPTASPHKDVRQRDAALAADRRRAERDAERRHWERLLRSARWKYPKPGHSVKQGQRMALKARNRRRSK